MSEMELLQERYELAGNRLKEIAGDTPDMCFGDSEGTASKEPNIEAFAQYFSATADFLVQMGVILDWVAEGGLRKASLEELKDRNYLMYQDILPEHYEESFANPAYASRKLGSEFGSLLSFLYYEMRSIIGFVYEQNLEGVVIRMELFVEIYGIFYGEWQENRTLPQYEQVRSILYWYAFDYADIAALERVREMVEPEDNYAAAILENADLTDLRYLYWYGEYITDNEIQTARFLMDLPQETIDLMADTYTEGYRIGFELGGKDLSRKQTVDLHYTLGFERMMRKAVQNFAQMGLRPVIRRPASSILYNPSLHKSGFLGANPNKQYDFDHKDDKALFLDKAYLNRKLEVMRTAYEEYRELARLYAGPAVLETFGEARWEPVNKGECLHLTQAQQELWVEYNSQAGQLQREFIPEDERSFTIIAFPVPQIGEKFPEIFREIIRINTLDYNEYRQIQQTLIDALDQADSCIIKGMNGNRTDLRVNLYKQHHPDKETIFENCVADVNIPVGEVFTSPVLNGTNGILHVKRVFLNGLEYRDLSITFENGMITDYNCGNFQSGKENKAFIQENILFHHKTLPLGEFAIGTNTTAYMAAQKYGIEETLPILIAEKMGPHFAVGDTCYSHAEDIPVFNPDGKEIVARDNERSLLRNSDPAKAYFNCHTDITIPYDELGEVTAVKADGAGIPLIVNGRFVLAGSEALNKPFDQQR